MAAPTDVFVEAISITSVELWWTYSGSTAIGIYGSTDGSSYSLFATATPVGATNYQVTGLVAATKYWFKLTDDLGSTFSSVVTTWTHECMLGQGGQNELSLPRFDGESQQSDDLNNMAQRIEIMLGNRILSPGQCVACPVDGAVVINCGEGCDDWVLIADQNINSITINQCDQRDFNLEILFPANATTSIGGWPAGFGFGGGEGKWNKFVTGSTGGSASVSSSGGGGKASAGKSSGRNSYNKGSGPGSGGGGGGGSACTCVPKNGGLTIKSCNANNSLDCSSGKSLRLIACGGKEPYTWSNTGTVGLSRTSGSSVSVTPPANANPSEPGTAYVKYGGRCCDAGGVPKACPNLNFQGFASNYGCDDVADTSCGQVTQQPGDGGECISGTFNAGAGSCAAITFCFDDATCTYGVCDARTAAMIAAGCAPCGVAAAGATVTVTDALGTQFTIVLGA